MAIEWLLPSSATVSPTVADEGSSHSLAAITQPGTRSSSAWSSNLIQLQCYSIHKKMMAWPYLMLISFQF